MENQTIYVTAGGVAVTIAGFLTFRKWAQHRLAAKVVQKYEEDKLVMGPLIYIAAYGKVPGVSLSLVEVKAAAFLLAKAMLPVMGFSFPSEADVIIYAQKRALAVAKANPGALAILALQQGGEIVGRLQTMMQGAGYNPTLPAGILT